MRDFLNRHVHLLLFLLTAFATTMAGVEWITGKLFISGYSHVGWEDVQAGFFYYAVPFLGILTCHEFGHYFTARYYRIDTSLPYYIPLWLSWIGLPLLIGTMGAFIRLRETPRTTQQFFDVGIAGPLAGFVVALGVVWYGFSHLPPPSYVFDIHPEYAEFGDNYADYVYEYTYRRQIDSLQFERFRNQLLAEGDTSVADLKFQPRAPEEYADLSLGTNLIFEFCKKYVANNPAWVPPPQEMFHYPFLLAGYLALLFTAINLIPVGQLDGGHILYGLIGERRHRMVSPILFVLFVTYAGLGAVSPMDFHSTTFDSLFDTPFFKNVLYVGFLYFTFARTVPDPRNIWLLVVGVFTVQYLFLFTFPSADPGFTWLLFSFLIGRFLGVYHPRRSARRASPWAAKSSAGSRYSSSLSASPPRRWELDGLTKVGGRKTEASLYWQTVLYCNS